MTKTVTLGEICEIYGGGTPSREVRQYFGGGIPWLTPTEIAKDKIDRVSMSRETLTQEGLANSSAKLLPIGSVLMTSRASIGNIAIAGNQVTTNQGFISFVCPPTLDNKFLAYWLWTNKSQFENAANGATFKEISRSTIKGFQIPLPPLSEQRRIAALLDRADALRQKDRQLLAHYDQLAQSIFLDLFGDPVKNEKGWEVIKTGSVIDKIVAGDSYGGDERPLKANELGVLKVSAVTSGQFKPDEYKAVPKSTLKKKVIHPHAGDLLFSRANTRELVAATCIVDKDYDNVFLPDKLWRIDLIQSKCNQYFLKALLSQKTFRHELTKTATGTSGSMLNVSMEKLRDLLIWLPPLSLQTHFAGLIEQIEKQKAVVRQQMAASEALFGRLLQESFG